jgi:hypothetical protein
MSTKAVAVPHEFIQTQMQPRRAAELKVYLYLCSRMDWTGTRMTPPISLAAIAQAVGLSRRAATAAVRVLDEQKLIQRRRLARQATSYHVVVPWPAAGQQPSGPAAPEAGERIRLLRKMLNGVDPAPEYLQWLEQEAGGDQALLLEGLRAMHGGGDRFEATSYGRGLLVGRLRRWLRERPRPR